MIKLKNILINSAISCLLSFPVYSSQNDKDDKQEYSFMKCVGPSKTPWANVYLPKITSTEKERNEATLKAMTDCATERDRDASEDPVGPLEEYVKIFTRSTPDPSQSEEVVGPSVPSGISASQERERKIAEDERERKRRMDYERDVNMHAAANRGKTPRERAAQKARDKEATDALQKAQRINSNSRLKAEHDKRMAAIRIAAASPSTRSMINGTPRY